MSAATVVPAEHGVDFDVARLSAWLSALLGHNRAPREVARGHHLARAHARRGAALIGEVA